MTDQFVLTLLAEGGTTAILLAGVIALWRDNQALRAELREARSVSAGNTALLLDQNDKLETIHTHVQGEPPAERINFHELRQSILDQIRREPREHKP